MSRLQSSAVHRRAVEDGPEAVLFHFLDDHDRELIARTGLTLPKLRPTAK
jgi:hypothetical protein